MRNTILIPKRGVFRLAALLAIMLMLGSCGRDRGTPSFAVTADQILSEFRDNPEVAETKYSEKTGKIAGWVNSLEPQKRSSVILRVRGIESSGGYVFCLFTGKKALAQLSGVRVGQEITVIGKVLGYDLNYGIRVADCALDLEVKEKPVPAPKPDPEPEPERQESKAPQNTSSSIDSKTYAEISIAVDRWNRAHNEKDFDLFSDVYADYVNFYNKNYSNSRVVEEKRHLLTGKYTDFYQETYGLTLRKISSWRFALTSTKPSIIQARRAPIKPTWYSETRETSGGYPRKAT